VNDSRSNPLKVDQYRELFERSADAILIISGERFVDCNEATVKMLRYRNRAELLQTHPSALSPEFQNDGKRSFEKANEMMQIAFERGSHRFEWDHKRANGEVFPVEVLLTAVPHADGHNLHVVWRDITERKKLEAEVLHAQKIESIGQLAGTVAHDFNNLLVAIIGYSELLSDELARQPELLAQVEEIHRAAERGAEMTSQLLACSRKQVRQTNVVDLNEILVDWSRMIEVLSGVRTRVIFDLCPHPLLARVDAGQMEQVLMNITANSRDAMPKGGDLRVSTQEVFITNAEKCSRLKVLRGDYAILRITDTGTGMSATELESAFDPFFTTKARGKGTGLGLASVRGIATQSGGDVRISSPEGQGTTIEIFIPIAKEKSKPSNESTRRPRDQQKTPAPILLAEDDATVAALVSRALQRDGFEVQTASNGKVALELARNQNFEFSLLITDVIMPVMNGPELARRIRLYHPKFPIIFMSGYADTALAEEGFDVDQVDLIRKPFSIAELSRRVKAALAI
jgi:two-component system cell cycle sensor histidine kinase/response regulator CckA